ncbi:MAG: hypothetical protein ACI9G1_004673 [Pirellulaceae bacterium]|jgi:hypothetical protein
MKHVNADNQPEIVKEFLLSLNLDDDGSIIECGGKLIHVTQPNNAKVIADIQSGYDEMLDGKGRAFGEADASIRSELGFTPRDS